MILGCLPLQPRLVPVTIPLDAPLGDRKVVDLGRASADDVFGVDALRLHLQSPSVVSAPEPSADAGAVTCRGAVIPGSRLSAPTPISTLGDTRYRFEEAGVGLADDDSWNVVENTPERVRVLHVLGTDAAELYEISRVTIFGGYTAQWEPTKMGACTLTPAAG